MEKEKQSDALDPEILMRKFIEQESGVEMQGPLKYNKERLWGFIEKQTGVKISEKNLRADLLKCLLVQNFGQNKLKIGPMDYYHEIYGHPTTEFGITYDNYMLRVEIANDDSGILLLETERFANKSDSVATDGKHFWEPVVPSEGYFDPIIKFINSLTEREQLITAKCLHTFYLDEYKKGNRYAFSQMNVWAEDGRLTEQIVKDSYNHRFNDGMGKVLQETQYNEAYGNYRIKQWVEYFKEQTAKKDKEIIKE